MFGIAFTVMGLVGSGWWRVALFLAVGVGAIFLWFALMGYGRVRVVAWVVVGAAVAWLVGIAAFDPGDGQDSEAASSTQALSPSGSLSESPNATSASESVQPVLNELRAGYTREQFDHRLGSALAENRVGEYTSLTYGGRDYWLHALVRSGTVVMFAVTSCTSQFRPQFNSPGGPTVELQKSTFSDLETEASYHLFNHSTSGDWWAFDIEES
jgi:hypothetical protein